MQGEITAQCQGTPIRLSKFKRKKISNVGKDVEKLYMEALVGIPTLESCLEHLLEHHASILGSSSRLPHRNV